MTRTVPSFVLASASPARSELLNAAGIAHETLVSGVDESAVPVPDSPEELSLILARSKATAVAERLRAAGPAERPGAGGPAERPGAGGAAGRRTPAGPVRPQAGNGCAGPRRLVLGCDSVLAFDGAILGKPGDAVEAAARWRRMRGRSGVLHTGHSLVDLDSGARAEAVGSTVVHFAAVTDAEIDAYVASGEPMHVAGAFKIDGLGAPFVERIEGDHGTVIGLSLPLLRRLCAELGIAITDLWRRPAAGPTGSGGAARGGAAARTV